VRQDSARGGEEALRADVPRRGVRYDTGQSSAAGFPQYQAQSSVTDTAATVAPAQPGG